MANLLTLALLFATTLRAADLPAVSDARLEAALHTEVVTGDLKAAAAQYTAILADSPSSRPIAARALLHLAECQERLGLRDAARASYHRLATDFADQSDPAAQARIRLASWTNTPAGPQNLHFERATGAWSGGPIEVHQQGCRTRLPCAVIASAARITQSFPAAAYRGQTVRLRAWLRVDASAPAQLSLLDDRLPAASARWTQYEIAAEIDSAAQTIQFGVTAPPKGRVWIDAVSFQTVRPAELTAATVAIQKLYAAFDAADLAAIDALALPDAQYRDPDSKQPLRTALEKWTAPLAHHTTVTALHLAGAGAQVNARTEYVRSEANGAKSVSYVDTRLDTWLRAGAAWKLKEYRVLTTRQVDSSTDAQTAKRAAADLKRLGAPLATIEVGHTFYDLAPFGMAVGDARIVALGEATFGTREFFQMKHRLLEYLVREKGFSVFAINATWLESSRLDLYIKSGEGDPKALLTGMLWPWNTEEALDVVQWMRDFNQATGAHPTLSFASFGVTPASVVIPRVVDYLKRYAPPDAAAAETNYSAVLEMESRLGEVYDDAARRATDNADKVLRLLDAHRDALIQSSSAAAWRQARQAAEMARQSAGTHIAAKGSSYGNEMMARNIEWLAADAYPGEKIVIWGHNALIGYASGDPEKSVGAWLREEFGKDLYVTGFAFHRGELLAIGVQNGNYAGVATQTIPEAPGSNGDSVLSAAGMPVFFLDLRTVPTTVALGRWLAEPHAFIEVGALWNRDDPQSNSHLKSLSKSYDGLIFLEEGHAAHPL